MTQNGLTTETNSLGQDEITAGISLEFGNALAEQYYGKEVLPDLDPGSRPVRPGEEDIEVEVVPEPGTWASCSRPGDAHLLAAPEEQAGLNLRMSPVPDAEQGCLFECRGVIGLQRCRSQPSEPTKICSGMLPFVPSVTD